MQLQKFFVPILNCLTISEFTVKDSFSFAKEIFKQDSSFYMCSLDVDLLFTNIPLEETINICTESIYHQMILLTFQINLQLRNCCPQLLTSHILFVMNFCANKQMVQLWAHHQEQLLLIRPFVLLIRKIFSGN